MQPVARAAAAAWISGVPPSQQGDRRPVVPDRQPVAVGRDQARPRPVYRASVPALMRHSPSIRSTLLMVCTTSRSASAVDGLRERGIGGLVGDHDDAGTARLATLVDHALLAHLGDADLALAEFGCHSGQHAGPIGNVHVDVVTRGDHADRRDRQLGVLRLPRSASALNPVARRHHHVTHDRRRGRRPAGALAVEHQPPSRLGLDHHRVEGAVDRGQRMRQRDQCRVDTGRNPLLAPYPW